MKYIMTTNNVVEVGSLLPLRNFFFQNTGFIGGTSLFCLSNRNERYASQTDNDRANLGCGDDHSFLYSVAGFICNRHDGWCDTFCSLLLFVSRDTWCTMVASSIRWLSYALWFKTRIRLYKVGADNFYHMRNII